MYSLDVELAYPEEKRMTRGVRAHDMLQLLTSAYMDITAIWGRL